MVDEERFSLYEDLSDYEKEVVKDEAPVTPPITKKQPIVHQTGPKAAKSQAAKYKKPAKPGEVGEYVHTRAFVVHGIPYGKHYTGCEENRNAGDYRSTLAPGRS